MFRYQYKGISKEQYTSLLDNERMCFRSIDTAHAFIIEVYHLVIYLFNITNLSDLFSSFLV